jgi:hypothetical protein
MGRTAFMEVNVRSKVIQEILRRNWRNQGKKREKGLKQENG